MTAAADFFTKHTWRGRPYLVSPFVDLSLAGGLSLVFFAALLLFFPVGGEHFSQQKITVVLVTLTASYFINDPHFIVSYQLLYRGYIGKLKEFRHHRELWIRYLVAGIGAPAAMVLYFSYALMSQRNELFGYALFAMSILVGWHYNKQAFGIFMMMSSMKKIFYSSRQRLFLLANSYVVWLYFCLAYIINAPEATAGIITAGNRDFLGLEHIRPGFTIPPFLLTGLTVLVAVSALAALAVIYKQRRPSLTAMLGYFSMYYLLLFAIFHPLWILIYPVFHSMQYLLFVFAYKRGEVGIQMAATQTEKEKSRIRQRLAIFIMTTLICAFFFFDLVPNGLQLWLNPNADMLLPLTAVFIIFINIHHYFIDNVIWRKENPLVARHLFYRHATPQAAEH